MLYDIVVYIFSSFWRWIGALMMLVAIFSPLSGIIKIIINRKGKEEQT